MLEITANIANQGKYTAGILADIALTFPYPLSAAGRFFHIQTKKGARKVNVLVVEPGIVPYEKEINGLQEMQAVVGGLIQAIYPYQEPVALVANDEGILMHLPFNRSVEGGYGGVFGTFFVCGLTKDDFCSLTPEQIKTYREKFQNAEILLGYFQNEPVTMQVSARPKNMPSKSQDQDNKQKREEVCR